MDIIPFRLWLCGSLPSDFVWRGGWRRSAGKEDFNLRYVEDGPLINQSTKLFVQFCFGDGALLELDQAAVYSISQCDRSFIARVNYYLETFKDPSIKCVSVHLVIEVALYQSVEFNTELSHVGTSSK